MKQNIFPVKNKTISAHRSFALTEHVKQIFSEYPTYPSDTERLNHQVQALTMFFSKFQQSYDKQFRRMTASVVGTWWEVNLDTEVFLPLVTHLYPKYLDVLLHAVTYKQVESKLMNVFKNDEFLMKYWNTPTASMLDKTDIVVPKFLPIHSYSGDTYDLREAIELTYLINFTDIRKQIRAMFAAQEFNCKDHSFEQIWVRQHGVFRFVPLSALVFRYFYADEISRLTLLWTETRRVMRTARIANEDFVSAMDIYFNE